MLDFIPHACMHAGFSFGGMLACYNAARLWKETCISVDILEKNVVCITFGQPMLAIPYVDKTIASYTKFEATIHAIYDQEDVFPKLLRNDYTGIPKIDHGGSIKALTSAAGVCSPSSHKLQMMTPMITDVRMAESIV